MFGYQIDQQIYNAAIRQGANNYLAKLVVAQARHETGNYNNNQTKTNNNIFGFKYSKNSSFANEGNISPEGNAYAKYNTISDAISDYFVRYWALKSNDNRYSNRLEHFNAQINSLDTNKFASLLKSYGYYHTPSNETVSQSIGNYQRGIDSALKRINVVEFVEKNKNYIALGGGLILLSIAAIVYLRNNK